MSVHTSIHVPVHMNIHMSIHMFIHTFIHMFIHMSIHNLHGLADYNSEAVGRVRRKVVTDLVVAPYTHRHPSTCV